MVDNLIGQDEEALDEPMFTDEELSAGANASNLDSLVQNDEPSPQIEVSEMQSEPEVVGALAEDVVSEERGTYDESIEGSEELVSEEEEDVPEEKDEGNWYTLQCFSLQEHKVSRHIQQMIDGELKEKLFAFLLPEEETVEIKNNKRQERLTKIYPGYIFVRALPDEEVWFKLRQIPGVATIIGSKVPTPISESEMDKILRQMGDKTKKIEIDFEVDEVIRVVSGPFRGYSGVISEINSERGKLKALISIFGRETPVELDFDQVEQTVGS